MKEELDKQAEEFRIKKARNKSEMKEFALQVEANDQKLLEKEIQLNEEQERKIQELEAERMRQARIRKALKRQE